MTGDTGFFVALKKIIASLPQQWRAARSGADTPPTSGAETRVPAAPMRDGPGTRAEIRIDGHIIGRDFVQIIQHATPPGHDAQHAQNVIARYLHALAIDVAGVNVNIIHAVADPSRQAPLELADIYVPLDTTLRVAEDLSLDQWLHARGGRNTRDSEPQRETQPVPVLAALAAHRELTLIGKPGSGKTTFGARMLLALAQVWQGDEAQLAVLGPSWPHGALLPVRIVLRRFAEELPAGTRPATARDLWDFVGRELKSRVFDLPHDAMAHVERIAAKHGALVVFDGLDECGDEARRQRVLAGVDEFMRIADQRYRFIMTARPYAWPSGPDPARGVYSLADLNGEQIDAFIHAWYAAVVKQGWPINGDVDDKRNDLLRNRSRPDLQMLAENPLLLTLIASLHTSAGRMPDDRVDLYEESVKLLLQRWSSLSGADKALLDELGVPHFKLDDLRAVLAKLAFDVHRDNAGREGAADIPEHRLVNSIAALLNDSADKAALVVDYIEKRAGLLLGQGMKDEQRQFTFPHRTFQEFLAACHLSSRGDFASECLALARDVPGHWQVVLPLAARLAGAERGAAAAHLLIGGRALDGRGFSAQPAKRDWACALLAGMQLSELGLGALNANAYARGIEVVPRVTGWLCGALAVHPDDGGLPARLRAQAGDLLARLGDPRFAAEHAYLPAEPLLGFVRIAADPEFRIGTRAQDVDKIAAATEYQPDDFEINETLTPTEEFHIARYAVTVAQFRAFVVASGLVLDDQDALRDADHRPVRRVGWHEARAYCAWLTTQLSSRTQFPDHPIAALVQHGGWRVDLPSELEWEKAARGTGRDQVFTWGDVPDPERANYDDTQLGDTAAVGCFPANALDLHDMLGNVWQWTRSLWGEDYDAPTFGYPYRWQDLRREDEAADDKVLRVVRGRSWHDPRVFARVAFRFRNHPGLRDVNLGFRVVLRSSPVSSR